MQRLKLVYPESYHDAGNFDLIVNGEDIIKFCHPLVMYRHGGRKLIRSRAERKCSRKADELASPLQRS
jgi:hypothetical protein